TLPGRVAAYAGSHVRGCCFVGLLFGGQSRWSVWAGAWEVDMTRLDQSTGRLSLRNSILVWVAGIVTGWGGAVVLGHVPVRDSAEEGRLADSPLVAEAEKAAGRADIEPAAGSAEDARQIGQNQRSGPEARPAKGT